MTELIANKEAMSLVRAKLNAALVPFASRAEFEAAIIPQALPVVHVIGDDGATVYQLTRAVDGAWISGDGATWAARQIASIEEVAALLAAAAATRAAAETAAATATAAVANLLVVVPSIAAIPVPPAANTLYVVVPS